MFAFYGNLSKKQSVLLLIVKGAVIAALVVTIAKVWFF